MSANSIMTDDEEDVIFEGSPIYKHLQDVGYTDFQAEECPMQTYTEKDETKEAPDQKQSIIYSFGTTLKLFCSSVTRTNRAKEKLYKEIIHYIADSKLINYSDQLLLEHFLPEGRQLLRSGNISSSFKWHPPVASIAAVGCIPLGLLVSNSLLLWCSSVAVWSSIFALSAPIAWWLLQDLQSFYKICSRIKHLKKLVTLLQESCQLCSRSLRLLQEVDLISRGFVLARGSSSFINQDGSESPPCTTLRLALGCTSSTVSRLIYDLHMHLAPYVKHYPCLTGLFSEQEIFGIQNHESPKEHLKHLKEVTNLMSLQTSTILTELILVLGNPLLAGKLLEKEMFSMNQLTQLKKAVRDLSNHLEYTKVYWLHNRTEEEKPRSLEAKRNCVYLALHSLSLHMHAFLYKVQDLENKFQIDEKDDFPVAHLQKSDLEALPPYEDVKQQLQLIKAELDSCQGCWEEAVARVDRKYCVKSNDVCENVNENDIENKNDEPQVIETKKMPIILSEIDEPVAQDEVFEAFIEEEYSSRLEKVDYDDGWNLDAKKRRQELKQQKNQGKLVLNELQPILQQRREMWEKREIAALKRKQECTTNMVEISEIEATSEKGHNEEVSSLKEASETNENITLESDSTMDKLKGNHFPNIKGDQDRICLGATAEDEVDSDDERLKVYRRVKQELDNYEECKMNEPETQGFGISFPLRLPIQTEFTEETSPDIPSDTLSNASLKGDEHYETVDNKNTDDEHSDIDWSSTQLPCRQMDTLEDRLTLLSGGLKTNLSAGLAAEASELSKKFRLAAMGPVATFGGKGECETFGSSESEESDG